jgi:hypothetical protein
MYLKLFALAIGFSILISCQSKTEEKLQENLTPNSHKVTVEEVIQAKTYTFIRVKEKNIENWLAISKRQVNKDDILYYGNSLEMKDFQSKELNRTFETILFVAEISDSPATGPVTGPLTSHTGNKNLAQKQDISVPIGKDGITIAELFSKKEKYSAKTITIKGQVVKFNSGIMGKNWAHLQDGTSAESSFDLTVTTNDVVKVGDVATFKGKITLNKDFGAGYSYDVIMEEAKLETN